jgi:intracellular sulfur oxidation DsrE/DsrF family protein
MNRVPCLCANAVTGPPSAGVRWVRAMLLWLAIAFASASPALAQATRVQTPYANPKAIVDVYLDHPAKMGAALYWVRSLVNPLTEAPYSLLPEDMSIIVLLHGTELVTVARKNEAKYEEVVQRMRYYASQGVKFKVCGLALQDYGYGDGRHAALHRDHPVGHDRAGALAEPGLCADHATGAGQTARDRGHPLRGRAGACRVRPQSPPIRSRAVA